MMNLEHLMATMLPLSAAEASLVSERPVEPSLSELVPKDVYRWALDPDITHAMAHLYRPLAPVVERYEAGLWVELVRGYAAQVRGEQGLDVVTVGFVRYLERRRLLGAVQPRWIEECAEYLACHLRAATSFESDGRSDDSEPRVFIRRFRFDVARLLHDPRRSGLPGADAQATTYVVYRSWKDAEVYVLEPRPVHLFALGRRHGDAGDLGGMTASFVDDTERWLEDRGVLLPLDAA